MVYITHIHMSVPSQQSHEHIEKVKWSNPQDGDVGESTVPTMVEWIENKNGLAKVTDGRNAVDVGVVHPAGHGSPYLRTHADGKWTNNLLALPRY